MVKQIRWSPEALDDLERISGYIAKDSVFYAKAVVEKIVATVESIPEFPLIGRVVPEMNQENYRERFVHRFRVIYKLFDNEMLVLAVIHGHQDFERQLPRIYSVKEAN